MTVKDLMPMIDTNCSIRLLEYDDCNTAVVLYNEAYPLKGQYESIRPLLDSTIDFISATYSESLLPTLDIYITEE